MTRKDPNRKEKIIETAIHLFTEKGYSATTIDEIRRELGISKGAFYHYFGSKQDLLDSVIDVITRRSLEDAMEALSTPGLNPKERLVAFFTGGRQWRMKHMKLLVETVGLLYRPKNALLFMKAFNRNVELTRPMMIKVLREAMKDGIISIEDPEVTAELLQYFFTSMSIYFFKTFNALKSRNLSVDEVAQDLMKRINISLTLIENMIGLEPRTIPRLSDADAQIMKRWITEGLDA